jgi:hypothetical protein
MLTATFAIVLVAGFSSGANAAIPNLQVDYAQARTLAASENKPIAVFIGNGAGTMGRMVTEGIITADAAKLLREKYVALYVDTSTPAGQELASRFGMTEGLVISGPGGSVQAYRHSGPVSEADLNKQLTYYAHAGQPTSTVYAGTPAPAGTVYPAPARSTSGAVIILGSGCANGSCSTVVPAGNYVIPATPIGGCSTGSCPVPVRR